MLRASVDTGNDRHDMANFSPTRYKGRARVIPKWLRIGKQEEEEKFLDKTEIDHQVATRSLSRIIGQGFCKCILRLQGAIVLCRSGAP